MLFFYTMFCCIIIYIYCSILYHIILYCIKISYCIKILYYSILYYILYYIIFLYIYIYIYIYVYMYMCRYIYIYSMYVYVYMCRYVFIMYICTVDMFYIWFACECNDVHETHICIPSGSAMGADNVYEPSVYRVTHMGVSINGGTPKFLVYNGKSYLKWMIWGYPHFRKPPHVYGSSWGQEFKIKLNMHASCLIAWPLVMDPPGLRRVEIVLWGNATHLESLLYWSLVVVNSGDVWELI